MGQKEQQELDLYTNRRLYTGLGLLAVCAGGWTGIYYAVEFVKRWWP